MQRFSSGGFGHSNDPWFRVGTVDVNTTTLVAGLSLFSFFVFAIEGNGGPIARRLWFSSQDVLHGQIWRLITWPIPNKPDIWALLTIVIFYMFANQIENALGKVRFAWFLAVLTLSPALFLTLADLVSSIEGFAAGLDILEIGILVAFVAYLPSVKFFFGIPGWVLVGVVVGLRVLDLTGNRAWYALTFLAVVVITALLEIKAVGLAEDVAWIPKVPLPAGMGGDPYRSQANPRRQKKTKSHLSSVPASNPLEDQIKQMEIDDILDQVAERGLDSLSKEQRKQLETYSKEQRKKKGL